MITVLEARISQSSKFFIDNFYLNLKFKSNLITLAACH